jgi:Flp pilus assembly protein TadG
VSRGQALLELAVCAPVVILLTLGALAGAEVIDARAGLDAATKAAAASAARAPDPAKADSAARARFQSMVAGYPLSSAHLTVSFGKFSRTDGVLATASANVDLSWAEFVISRTLVLESRCTVPLEPWRSHRR